MWVPSNVIDWLKVSKEAMIGLQIETSALRVEKESLKSQLLTAQANFNWLAVRVNALEAERAQLIKRAYGIDLPVPEITTTSPFPKKSLPDINSFSFEDVGDEMAKTLGLS